VTNSPDTAPDSPAPAGVDERVYLTGALAAARTFHGDPTADGLILKRDETVYLTVAGARRLEERKGPSRWQGGSAGISVPLFRIGSGTVRGHIGQTQGHLIPGEPMITPIDTGTVWFTSQRIIFQGEQTTCDIPLGKAIAYNLNENGSVTVSVSGRAKPLTIWIGNRGRETALLQSTLELVLATANGTRDAYITGLEQALQDLDDRFPEPLIP
jgi:hypothetical protein